jgi:hypothetical protein
MNRHEAGALGYPTLAGKSSPSPNVQLPRFDGAGSGIPPGNGRQFRLRLTRGRCGPETGLRTAAGYFGSKLIAAGSRQDYPIGHGGGENGVHDGGFPGKEEISANNVHQ